MPIPAPRRSATTEGSRRRDGVVTRVRKAAAVVLMTPLAATAIAISGSTTAQASGCIGFGSAEITPPTGTLMAGSTIPVKATVHNMLLEAHLQISGPGLDQQVGKSVFNGDITDQVTIPQAGYFTLAVIGNATHCTYETNSFTVKARPTPRPTHSKNPHKTLLPTPGGGIPNSSSPFPGITPGGSTDYLQRPFNESSPFSLPSVAPDGVQGFGYPTPDPQVAAPPTKPLARNVAQTTPVKWGQSIALAAVLLLLSAHLGMWSRRQRLAAEGPRPSRGGKLPGRKRGAERATAVMAATATLADAPTREANDQSPSGDLNTIDEPTFGTPNTGGMRTGETSIGGARTGRASVDPLDRRFGNARPASSGMAGMSTPDASNLSASAPDASTAGIDVRGLGWSADESIGGTGANYGDAGANSPWGSAPRMSRGSSSMSPGAGDTPDAGTPSNAERADRTDGQQPTGRPYQGRRRRS